MRRSAVSISIVSVLMVLMAIPAAAAAPANDDRANATEVGALPFNDAVDTSEATPQGGDPECFSDPSTNPSVWYSFTPSETRRYIATTRNSDYDTVLWVGTNNGGLRTIDCNDDFFDVQSWVSWRARAGVEYLLMVGSCCGDPGGDLAFRIKKAPLPPTFSMSLSDRARLTRNGKIELRGSVSCRRAPQGVIVEARVRQDYGRIIIRGRRIKQVPCGSDWVMQVGNFNYRFAKGKAKVHVSGEACNSVDCRRRTIDRIVTVR